MIKLRTNAHDYSIVAKDLGDDLGSSMHDALAAHAYERAIEARIAKYESERGYQGDILTNAAIKSLRELKYCAESILAELLKEAK